MTKLEALREAQLWVLKEGSADPALVRGATADGPEIAPVPKVGRLPPFYWAAFTLAGDWR
jgi:CHAT domain-containing protein